MGRSKLRARKNKKEKLEVGKEKRSPDI